VTARVPWGEPTAPRPPDLPTEAPILLESVSRWYGSVVAVNDVSFAVGPGITGLLGPNGAGKSTILGMIAGLLPPSTGRVTLLGAPAWRHPDAYRNVGLVPERETVPGHLSGRGFVGYAARLQGLTDPDGAARSAIETVDLTAAMDRPTATYSKGMKQRIVLASALVHDPPVLLLDEPFNGVDPRQRLHLMTLLRRMGAEGRTVLFSSHILEEVEQVARQIEVVVSGRHAASGDFGAIRRLMTDRPNRFVLRTSDDRLLASALLGDASVRGARLRSEGGIEVEASDFGRFSEVLPRLARDHDVSLHEVTPTDESLESVFAYLVGG
jgi:ABC-2 type transport system ATP-binding protein